MSRVEQRLQSERHTFLNVTEWIDQICGLENAEELDSIAERINGYYQRLTMTDLMAEAEIYNLQEFNTETINRYTSISGLHQKFREGELKREEEAVVFDLFNQTDIFEPLLRKISSSLEVVPLDRAACLMYLFYQLENPFIGPTPEAKIITQEATRLFKDHNKVSEVSPKSITGVEKMVNELVLAATSWKSAWTYFGAHRAKAFLEMLVNPRYGPTVFADLAFFAENDRLICPPQILTLLRQLPEGEENDLMASLKRLYDEGESLVNLSKNGLNYQITGGQRRDEYEDLSLWIPEKWRHGIALSLGGGVGLIEIGRAEKLGLSGPIAVVDINPRLVNLTQSLVVENEHRFRPGDPCMGKSEVYKRQQNAPTPLVFIQAKLPLPPGEIKNLLRAHGIDIELPIRIIFDQRFSALYLKGEDLLTSIKSSLQLLSGGGVYFCSRGYPDRLVTDQVVQVNRDDHQPSVSLAFLHHTNTFFSTGSPLTKGRLFPKRAPLLAEFSRRDAHLRFLPLQDGEKTQELEKQQILRTINTISNKFLSCRDNWKLIMDVETGLSYSHLLVYAYATYQGLPLSCPAKLPDNMISLYSETITELAKLITIAIENKELLKDLDFSKKEEAVPDGFKLGTRALNHFFAKIKKNPDILIEPINALERLFKDARQVAIYPHKQFVEVALNYNPQEAISDLRIEALKNRLERQFKERFGYRLRNLEAEHSDIVLDAIWSLFNQRVEPNPIIGIERMTRTEFDDYYRIIEQIRRKLISLNIGKSEELDFSQIKNPQFYQSVISALKGANDKLWKEVLDFIDQQFTMLSISAGLPAIS